MLDFWRKWQRVKLPCVGCGETRSYDLLVGHDWRDLDALRIVENQFPSVECALCGHQLSSPVPIVQRRPLDPVQILIVQPSASSPDTSRLSETLGELADGDVLVGPLSMVPVAFGLRLLRTYTGLMMSGLDAADDDELGEWVRQVRASEEMTDVVGVVSAFVSSNDPDEASRVIRQGLDVLDDRWRPVRRRFAELVRAGAGDGEDSVVLESRLRRLEQWVLFEGEPPSDQSDLGAAAQEKIDRAIAEPVLDESGKRRDLLLEALDALRADHNDALLIGTLHSTVASLISSPQRSQDDLLLATELADELIDFSESVLGEDHRLVRRARNDRAVALLDRDILPDLALVELSALAIDCVFAPDPLLGDVLLNLAVATGEKRIVPTADEQVAVIGMMRHSAHLLSIHEPDDHATQVRTLNNLGAALRRAPLGDRPEYRNEASTAYREAQQLDDTHAVLGATGRFQLDANATNLEIETALEQSLNRDGLARVKRTLDALAERVCETFEETHLTRARTLLNLATLAIDCYDAAYKADIIDTSLLERSIRWATTALRNEDLPPELAWALRNSRAVSNSRPASDEKAHDADAAIAEYKAMMDTTELPADAGQRRATGRNLGQFHLGLGEWGSAADAYEAAADAADVMIQRATTIDGRISEIESASDLTLLCALCRLHNGQVTEAIAAIEQGRQRLASDAHPDDDLAPLLSDDQALVWVMTCTLGSCLIASAAGQVGSVHIEPLNSCTMVPLLDRLANAQTPSEVSEALRSLEECTENLLQPLHDFIDKTGFATVNIVAAGALSRLPLHTLSTPSSPSLASRITVRYLSTARSVSRLRLRPARDGNVSAIGDPDGTLDGARTEISAVRSRYPDLRTPADGTSLRAWLEHQLPDTTHLHLACHASVGPTPATTHFAVGDERNLTLLDLLEADLPKLDSVVAAACNTAAGSGSAPDELLGLAYGFIAAGAAEVVASLWHIDDALTALLVARLYHESHQTDLGTALARSQRWLMNLTNADLRESLDDPNSWFHDEMRNTWRARMLTPRHRNPDTRPFEGPANWGGLLYVGR